MSDDQENVDKITGSFLRSQTARELETQLRQLRKAGGTLRHKKKPDKEMLRQVPRMELKLPDIHSSSAQMKSRCGLIMSGNVPNSSLVIRGRGNVTCERQDSAHLESNKLDLGLHGNGFEHSKMLAIKPPKPTIETGKHYPNCFQGFGKGIFPVFSGPGFRPWSRGTREKKKIPTDGHYSIQEANVHRFCYKQQRPRNDCFNLGKILSEVSEISRVSENHTKVEMVPLTANSKILFPVLSQGIRLEKQDRLLNEPEREWIVPKKIIPVKKEQRLKKLLRQKLIPCYDLGPVMEPFDITEGETLGRKDPLGEMSSKADISQRKHEVFSFAVPHFRLPLLPSSRSELVKVSQVLTKFQLFPKLD